MVDSLSKGIVSVEVRLESESVPVDAIGSVIDEETVTIVPVDGVSLRKVGVFVKVRTSIRLFDAKHEFWQLD